MARASLKQIIDIYKKKGTNVSATCEALNISRKTFYDWKKTKPKLKEAIDEVDESMLDFAESKLMKKIHDDDTVCIIFYLKTKGRNRGYIERVENQVETSPFMELMKAASRVDDDDENDD